MKLLVLAHPRSGSTFIQLVLSKVYGVKHVPEPFTENDPSRYEDVILNLEQDDDYIIKIQSHNFFKLDKRRLNFKMFDRICVSERRDKTLSCISTYWAAMTNKWDYNINETVPAMRPFVVDKSFVQQFIRYLHEFNNAIEYLNENSISYTHLMFEDINLDDERDGTDIICRKLNVSPQPIKILKRKSFLNYLDYCLNYEEVHNLLNEYR